MSNVVRLPLPSVFEPGSIQTVQDFDYSDFCTLLEAGSASAVRHLAGMTLLLYPHATIVCTGDRCVCVSAPNSSLDFYLREAEAILNARAA